MLTPSIGAFAFAAGAAVASAVWWLRGLTERAALQSGYLGPLPPRQGFIELQRFRAAVDMCGDSIFIVDRETLQFVDVTAAVSARTGYSRDELLRMGPANMSGERLQDIAKSYDEVIAAGPGGIRTDSRGVAKDGSDMWVELHRHALKIDRRWLIISTARDITERKASELAAQRASRMFAALSATNEAIVRAVSPDELFQQVCQAAVHAGELLTASICIPDSATARVVAVAGKNADWLRELVLSIDPATEEGRGLIGSAIRSGAPCISNDYMTDERTRPLHERARSGSVAAAAAFPLVQRDRIIGALLLHSEKKFAFDAEFVRLLTHMAQNIVFGLGNFEREAERRHAEQLLLITQGRLDRTTRGGSEGLWELAVASREIWVSPHLAELMGYQQQDFLSDNGKLLSIVHADSIDSLQESIERCIREGVPVDKEVRGRTRAGEWRWYRIRAAVERNTAGEVMTVSGSMRDITDMRRYHTALIEATEVAASASRAKSEFLANMSHEIRTPMNGVIGMVELLIDTPLNDMQRDYVETVRDSATALLTVINDILDFSKVEAGKLELEFLDIDVRDTVEDVARMLAIQARAKGLEVITHVDPALPDLVRGDAGRLRQVMLNLGGNAVKFTHRGEIGIDCKVLHKDAAGVTIRCEVRDSGVGIPAGRLGALFNAFTQVDSSTTRRFGGTGLGLSIVKRLVELMGGEVGVSSQEGIGSIFWFTAQLQAAQDDAKARVAPPVELRGQRIVIVDDNVTNRRVLMGQLSLCGMDAVCANSADEALVLMFQAAAEGRPFEVALLDQQMPGADGSTLGTTILSEPSLSATRLILLTSAGQRGDGRIFGEIGFAGYLLKPVTQRDLTDCLTMVLGVQAETWSMRSQPIVTRHALRSQRARDSRHILVAEDNLVNQKVARRVLEKLGFRVDVAGDGQAAFDAWQSGRYDLILMDCQMPVMDGYETTRKIRESEPGGDHIPIIALTAHAMKGADSECRAAGMDDYLSKPIDREQLHQMLLRWLDHQDSRPPHEAAG